MTRIAFLVTEALINMRRNALVVAGAVVAVFVSLTLTFGALMLNEIVRVNTLQWQDGVHVIVWLKDEVQDGISLEAQQQLLREILDMEEVKSASYVDKAAAYQEFTELFHNNPALLDNVDPSILPASIRIRLNDIEEYTTIEFRLAGQQVVKEVMSPGETIEQLADLSGVLNALGVGLAVVLGGSAVVLISNTIRMAIYARRDEVAIMKLVGASNWFIRIPFLLEGMMEGIIGAGLAGGAVFFARSRLANVDDAVSLFQFSIADSFFWGWALSFVVFGAVAGFLGSLVGLRKFLKV